MPAGLKLLVSSNKPQAIDIDFSMRSSVNFNPGHDRILKEFDSSSRIEEDRKFRTYSDDFEDVPSQRSIEIQSLPAEEVKENKSQSISLNTMPVQTASKQMNTACVETQETASQI